MKSTTLGALILAGLLVMVASPVRADHSATHQVLEGYEDGMPWRLEVDVSWNGGGQVGDYAKSYHLSTLPGFGLLAVCLPGATCDPNPAGPRCYLPAPDISPDTCYVVVGEDDPYTTCHLAVAETWNRLDEFVFAPAVQNHHCQRS